MCPGKMSLWDTLCTFWENPLGIVQAPLCENLKVYNWLMDVDCLLYRELYKR